MFQTFKKIFLFELKYRSKRPATYLYFGIFFLASFLLIALGGVVNSEKIAVNAPISISFLMIVLSIWGTLVSSAIMGVPIFRDLEHKTGMYFYAMPIKEMPYLLGRYLGSLVILILVFVSIIFGASLASALGPVFGWEDAERYAPFNLLHYLYPLAIFLIPNLIFSGTIFFSLVTLTKRISSAYAGSVLFFICYLVGVTLTRDIENRGIVDILDPYALNTFLNVTRYWTVVEQNNNVAELTGNLLYNRMLWLGISAILLLITLNVFKFSNFLSPKSGSKKKVKAKDVLTEDKEKKTLIKIPQVSQVFSFSSYLSKAFVLGKLEFQNIIRDVYFVAMLLGGALFLFLDGWFANQIYGTSSLPLTYYMLEAKDDTYIVFVLIIIIYYTGEIVYRDRSLNFSNISDALPVPNWLLYASKFLGITYLSIFLVTVAMLVGLFSQTIQGYYNYEIGVYLTELYLITLPTYLEFAALSFFVHILVNQKFIGHFVTIGIWAVMFGFRQIGNYNYNMFFYASTPSYLYSDMNGFGHFLEPIFWFNLYWIAFAGILIVIGNTLWNRGIETGFKNRFILAVKRTKRPVIIALTLFAVIFISSGAYIYRNVSVVNKYRTSEAGFKLQAEYEKKYKKYQFIAQPKVTDVKVEVDIYPSERKADVRGNMKIKNKTDEPIDTLHLDITNGVELTNLKINGQELKPIYNDELLRYRMYKFLKPLQPGATTTLEVDLKTEYKGFTNSGYNRELVFNGTFFSSSIFPSFGYNEGRELNSDKYRKKHDLPKKNDRAADFDDPNYKNQIFFTDDADFVTFEAVMSTSSDQMAIAPGYLQKEWEKEGRRYFHYKMDHKIAMFFSFISADYEVVQDKWKDINLEIYYHRGHNYNLDRFMESIKNSLAYCSENFSPYQHKQMRVLEFPRYSTFAQSFANTVPYSESFGWAADFSNEEDIDYAYYVTAHEVAHQWWGHQVIPRATKGANIVVESLAQYSAMMILEHKYKDDPMKLKKYLRYELNSYLGGRANESKKEPVFLENELLPYIHYRKGSLIWYAIKDFIGEEKLNSALKKFVKKNAFKEEPPYTDSRELYGYIKEVTPDSLQYFLEDCWEKITLYENRVVSAEYEKIKEDEYKVTLKVNKKKFYADSLGKETEASMNDWMDIGIFSTAKKDGKTIQKPIYMKKHRLKEGEETFEFTVKEKPTRAGIDPYNKLIDRNPEDNLKAVAEK